MNSPFLSEAEAYTVLQRAGWHVPRHAPLAAAARVFTVGEPIVLKGLGDEVWHKSELGAVSFMPFEPAALTTSAAAMRARIETAGHRWIDAVVCERIAVARADGLPTEGFVSLTRHAAGWMALVGCGGLQAEALAALAPPLRWPLALLPPSEALAELERHLLGRAWLGQLRGTRPLTTRAELAAWVDSIWALAAIAEAEGIELIELNPVGLDATGRVRPLDAVGRRGAPPLERLPPPPGVLSALTQPGRVAIAGVSAQADGLGHIIAEKLRTCPALAGRVVVIKPGPAEFLGLPCVPDVAALRTAPVDLLLLALPAPIAARVVTELLAQGGGARVVGLVAGGLGDGADTTGLGAGVAAELHAARAAGRWTPAVLGPNFLGHWVPERALDTTFIPSGRLAGPTESGGLAVLAQSGAFLLCRHSRQPRLRWRLGVALGNQLDVALPDLLTALADDAGCHAVGAYVEGFTPAQLAATVAAARRLRARGVPLVLLRAGRTAAGQAAAASHTGAMAGDLALEREWLGRVGVKFAPSIAAFDAALAWLSVFPRLSAGPLALITNAGMEAVNASDLATPRLPIATLAAAEQAELEALLAAEKLGGVVAPRVPLDLTPMARAEVFLRAAELLLRSEAAVLLVGLVPFTPNIATEPAAATAFAREIADLARAAGKPAGLVVDAGAAAEPYRTALAAAGLPVFARLEEAIAGLQVIGGQGEWVAVVSNQ
jgi:acyl-CoA synthetase (NDP forming)